MRRKVWGSLLIFLLSCSTENIDRSPNDSGTVTVMDAANVRLDSGDGEPDPAGLDAGFPQTLDAGFQDAGQSDIPGGGFIGSPCDEDQDCDYENGICFTENIQDGICTLACDRFCPDRSGFPVTFCVEPDHVSPMQNRINNQGACVSRCNFETFPGNGCRAGFGCIREGRYQEMETENLVCIPNAEDSLENCFAELAALGINFETSSIPDRSPSGKPNLICHVEDPVVILSPLHNVELAYYDGRTTSRVKAACKMAKALSATILDVKNFGVTRLLHIGTYNCRVISGTNRLSRHSMGDAIDIYGFEFEDGSRATLVDDWEHDTQTQQTMAAQFLYNAAYRWHDNGVWNTILTPNYNVGHDNHFHVDLTPGADLIRFQGERFIGPAPYED